MRRIHKPLNPAIVTKLIEKIASAKPAVLGVDIDTSDSAFAGTFPAQVHQNIIWARDASLDSSQSEHLIAGNVLGSREPSILSNSGLAILNDDPDDGKTRSYELYIDTVDGQIPTFPSLIVSRYLDSKRGKRVDSNSVGPRAIRFVDPKNQLIFPSSMILDDKVDGVQWRRRIEGRIVILGGSFYDADRHSTPIGDMSGAQVIANVINTELNGGGSLRLSTAHAFIFAIFFFCVTGVIVEIIGGKGTDIKEKWIAGFALLVVVPFLMYLFLLAIGRTGSFGYSFGIFLLMILLQSLNEFFVEPGLSFIKGVYRKIRNIRL